MRIIATENRDLGEFGRLVNEQEYISSNETLKDLYVFWGYAKYYDDTKPRNKKGWWFYEEMAHPPETMVLKDNAFYCSKKGQETSATWEPTEWILVGQG